MAWRKARPARGDREWSAVIREVRMAKAVGVWAGVMSPGGKRRRRWANLSSRVGRSSVRVVGFVVHQSWTCQKLVDWITLIWDGSGAAPSLLMKLTMASL